MTRKLLFVLQQKYNQDQVEKTSKNAAIISKVELAQPSEVECSCVPINVLKSDIDEGRSPFGDDDNVFCYQVDSKLVYQNSSFVNGKIKPNMANLFIYRFQIH